MERNHQVEDEYRKVLAFKTLMDSYKEQVHNLENDKGEILIEKQKVEEALRKAEGRCDILEQDKARDQEQIHALEDQLAELELTGGTVQCLSWFDFTTLVADFSLIAQPMDKIISNRSSAALDSAIDTSSMEENMKKANITELYVPSYALTMSSLQCSLTEILLLLDA